MFRLHCYGFEVRQRRLHGYDDAVHDAVDDAVNDAVDVFDCRDECLR